MNIEQSFVHASGCCCALVLLFPRFYFSHLFSPTAWPGLASFSRFPLKASGPAKTLAISFSKVTVRVNPKPCKVKFVMISVFTRGKEIISPLLLSIGRINDGGMLLVMVYCYTLRSQPSGTLAFCLCEKRFETEGRMGTIK